MLINPPPFDFPFHYYSLEIGLERAPTGSKNDLIRIILSQCIAQLLHIKFFEIFPQFRETIPTAKHSKTDRKKNREHILNQVGTMSAGGRWSASVALR